jgi:hypothetical protein
LGEYLRGLWMDFQEHLGSLLPENIWVVLYCFWGTSQNLRLDPGGHLGSVESVLENALEEVL